VICGASTLSCADRRPTIEGDTKSSIVAWTASPSASDRTRAEADLDEASDP
jgi:hypothetical protein